MSWLSDASANRIIQCYAKNFLDVSGNFKVRNNGLEVIDVSSNVSISPLVANYTTINTYSYSTSQLGSDIIGTEAGESRGKVVDMNEDGTVMIAGSYGLNNTSGTDGGAVFIYNYQNGSWVQKGSTIKPYYNTNSAAQFGHSVAINNDGDIVVVGSYDGSGTMEVYEYTNSAWSIKGSIINGNSSGHKFGGEGVAINGEGNIVAGYSMTGGYVKVYQYSNDTNDWVQIGSSISETTSTFSLTASHRPISLNNAGTRLAIGNHDHNSGAGRVIIYDYISGSWSQVGSTIEGSNFNSSGSEFGQNVSLSSDGTVLAVGAPDAGASAGGTVNIFKYDSVGNTWDQMGDTLEELDSYPLSYGVDLKLSGDGTLLITSDGAAPNSTSTGSSYRKGTVFIYKYTDDSWERIVKIVNSDNIDKWWGESCAISRDGTKFVGASRATDAGAFNTGLSRMYELIATVTSSSTVLDSYSNVGEIMKVSDTVVDISGTTWMNRGQSGGTISDAYQKGLVIESSKSSSSDNVIYVETAGQTQVFSVRADGAMYSANTLRHSSDDRRKINEQLIVNATETLKKLSPQTYTKLNAFVENGGTPTKTESGVIAQEVYYNAPELRHLVHTEGEPQPYDLSGTALQTDPDYTALGWGPKSATVDYIGLIPYLIKSNQEQQEIIDNKQQQISDNKKALEEDIQSRIAALEA